MPRPLHRLRFLRRLGRAARGQLEIATWRVGLESGLLEALAEPRTPAELARELGFELDLTAAWLRAAHAHGLLERAEGRYRRGAYARWMLEGGEAPAARALVEQLVHGHAPTLARLPELLAGGERPVFGDDGVESQRVAASARISEKAALRVLHRIPGVRAARRILDLGCGEGGYLADLLMRHLDAIGTGVEKDPAVAERARARFRVTEVSRRAQIEQGDLLTLELPRGAFDLVLLNNNLHYFDEEERRTVLERCFDCLAPGGVLAIQTPLVLDTATARATGSRAMLSTLDLFLRCHRNLHGLPRAAELEARLAQLGFDRVGRRSVLSGGRAVYVWARKPEAPRGGAAPAAAAAGGQEQEGADRPPPRSWAYGSGGPLSSTTLPSGSRRYIEGPKPSAP